MEIKCEKCGYVAVTTTPEAAVVHEGGARFKVVDKENKRGELECPKCGEKTPIDLSFMENY